MVRQTGILRARTIWENPHSPSPKVSPKYIIRLQNWAWFTIKVTVLQIRKTTETQRHRGNMGRKKGQDRRRIVVFSLVRVYSFPYSSDPISPCLSASVVVFSYTKKCYLNSTGK